ncbi:MULTISPECIES: magnesium transporter MgtE N-terminal domain-containing protein [Dietzia]|uniref:CBS domain-containing protein n=1 Tax=Dietzia cinnamea TaxID=321318 RepID=A0A177LFP4_9ACTN|nr:MULTISPECIES: CBS domain-containing protein [Dietzia]EFV91097.1 magnesium binding protein [Dietzia cinnamea P4]KZO58771.1 magnesium transporter [Dietzia maris]MBB1020084.1 CBS domain-containing protein [Dietzia sp. E1]MBM7229366.1 magnesium transporter [Dietzia cinnamea]MCT1640375.1 CBS domain-containing protein [Dietzia cinnamea]
MANLNKAFVARLAGLPVIGPDGDDIGRIRDVVVTMRSGHKPPRVIGLVVELPTRRRIFVPMLRVASIDPRSVSLVSGTINLHRFQSRPGENLVLGALVDSVIGVERDQPAGERSGNPDRPTRYQVVDVEIERQRSRDWLVSRLAVRERRGRSPLGRRGEVSIHPWNRIRGLDDAIGTPEHGAESLVEQYADLRPADVAIALRELPEVRRLEVARTLDDERLADILQELPHDEQTEIVTRLELERAADVLEAMDPDDVADLLGELPEKDAESYLERMNPEDSSNVRRLLTFDADTAGGLMTPEPIILSPQTTVAEALAHCRNPDLSPALASLVFVVRPPTATPTGKYLGCVHIQALLRELPSAMVAETVDTSLSALRPTDSVDAVTRFFATYNLVCGPVVDDEGHLLGAVAVDDLLDHLLPDDWRDMDLHDDTETAR